MIEKSDASWMQRAISLAKKGEYTVRTNPLVGCVLVKNNEVVGEGLHWKQGGPHAEVEALRTAGENARGATCYVTLEPCVHVGRTGPCVQALIEAGVKEVVFASRDPDPRVNGKSVTYLQESGILVREKVLEEESKALNKGFFSRIQRGRPYIRAKIAMSIDGRIAMENGESQWITSPQARQDVHDWRAKSGAILTTGKTVAVDDCRLSARDVEMDLPEGVVFSPPLRIIFDRAKRVTREAKIFQSPGDIWHVTEPNLDKLFRGINDRGINDVWVEAGPTFLGGLLKEGWIDEWIVYIAPKWLGHSAMPMVFLPGLHALADHIHGQFGEVKRIGPDLRISIALEEGNDICEFN